MAKEKKEDARAEDLDWRAVCKKNDYTGDWRPTKSEAIEDGLTHQNTHHSHVIRLEKRQRQ